MKSPLRPGDPAFIGGYELLARLGEGGMGAVFLGRRDNGPLVAIKIIKPEYAHEEEFRGRFRSEVKRARQVPPFCTAAVLDADPEHRTPYLVVEYVDGPSLDEVVAKEGPLADSRLQSVAVGVATALTAIHGAGVIHRDLKPRNVLFALGSPKVIDFGIARALEVTSQHTHPDQMVGTVAYMAPERFDGVHRDITPAADVFAWGAVIAYAGTGRTPFRADSPVATAARILTQPPDLSGLSGPLADLVALALAKDPEDRPTAHELLNLLLAQNTDPNPMSRPPAIDPKLRQAAEAAQLSGHHVSGGGPRPGLPVPPAKPRKSSRFRTVVAVTAAATLLATAAGIYSRRIGGADVESVGGPAPVVQATMPVPGAARGPWVVDALDRRGQWTAGTDAYDSKCSFNKGLVMATKFIEMTCAGPAETFAGDQAISVDVTVGTAVSCAEVQFRAARDSSYWLDLCPQLIRIRHQGALRTVELNSVKTSVITPGQRHSVRLTISDEVAQVAVDDTWLLDAALPDPTLLSGKVAFGLVPIDASKSQEALIGATFNNAEIRPIENVVSSASTVFPPFTDVRGSGTSIVKVGAYYPKAKSIVVEPVLFMSGTDYCVLLGLDPDSTDGPCVREWLTEDSLMRVTLPVSATAELLSVLDDPGRCAGDPVVAGTCKVPGEQLAKILPEDDLAQITVADGVVTSIAEVYTP